MQQQQNCSHKICHGHVKIAFNCSSKICSVFFWIIYCKSRYTLIWTLAAWLPETSVWFSLREAATACEIFFFCIFLFIHILFSFFCGCQSSRGILIYLNFVTNPQNTFYYFILCCKIAESYCYLANCRYCSLLMLPIISKLTFIYFSSNVSFHSDPNYIQFSHPIFFRNNQLQVLCYQIIRNNYQHLCNCFL